MCPRTSTALCVLRPRAVVVSVTLLVFSSCAMGCCSSIKKHDLDVFVAPPVPQGPRPEGIKLLLIVNPYSGGKKGAQVATQVEAELTVV